jgi:hypothetical protein
VSCLFYYAAPTSYACGRKEVDEISGQKIAGAVRILDELIEGKSERGWVERILPFNTSIASLLSVSPSDWSLTKQTRRVVLYGGEP